MEDKSNKASAEYRNTENTRNSGNTRYTTIKKAVCTAFCLILVWFAFFSGWWRCPIRLITGFACPGCGMSRALRLLLAGNVAGSFYWHPMLIPTIFAVILAGVFYLCQKTSWIRKLAYIWAGMMLAVWICRLLFIFPGTDMAWSMNSVFGKIAQILGIVS